MIATLFLLIVRGAIILDQRIYEDRKNVAHEPWQILNGLRHRSKLRAGSLLLEERGGGGGWYVVVHSDGILCRGWEAPNLHVKGWDAALISCKQTSDFVIQFKLEILEIVLVLDAHKIWNVTLRLFDGAQLISVTGIKPLYILISYSREAWLL